MTNVTGTLRIERNNEDTLRLIQSLRGLDRPFNATAKINRALQGPCPAAVELVDLKTDRLLHPTLTTDPPVPRVSAATLTVRGQQQGLPGQCCIKMAFGSQEYFSLKREHDLYSHELRELGGIAVPRCHGFFSAVVKGKLVGCLVLDLCVGTVNVPKDHFVEKAMAESKCSEKEINSYRKDEERQEFHRLIMAAICKLHSAGVIHDRLYRFPPNTTRPYPNYHHFVMQGHLVLVVDFATARPHSRDCPSGTPHVRISDRIGEYPSISCPELHWSNLLFGEHDLE